METITPGDTLITHKKKKRKSVPADPPPVMDTPVTHAEESPLRRKKKKHKRRLSADCVETVDLGEDVGMQEPEPPAQEAPQHKKKKKKRKSDIVVIDEEEQEVEVSVLETTATKKKKKQKTVEDKSKKRDEKKKRTSVVMTMVEVNTSLAELGGEQRKPIASGVKLAAVPSHHKKHKRKRNMEESEDSQEPGGNLDLLPELMSYVPDIGSRSPDIICKMLRHDLHRFREFRKKGIELRWGRFLKVENLQIQENVGNFLALTGIETANQLFFPERYKGQADSIKKLRVLHSFQEKIAEDVPRPCFKVYTRGKKMFDDRNYMGRFTEEENLQLQKLQRLHGNDWKTISRGMDRSTFSIQKRFCMIATASGPWAQQEVDRLVGAMTEHLEKLARTNQPEDADSGSSPVQLWLTKRQLYHKLPWKSISEKTNGRSWIQCRAKWFSILQPKLSLVQQGTKRGAQSAMSKIKLINALYSMNLEDAAEIDWEEVADSVGNVTPHKAQKLFNLLKMTRVPHSSALSFCDLIDFLHDKVVPMLQEKVKLDASFPLQDEVEVQQKYLLAHIISEEQFTELDNTT